MTAATVCLTDEDVAQLVDGVVSPERRAVIARHIEECPACRGLASRVVAARTRASLPARAEREEVLSRGMRVGRYEILQRIGAGGMGTVYAAHDPSLDRRIALKLIRAQVAGPEREERLLREAKAMARLSHPEVIAVYDAGRDGDRLFIAMELIEGGTLRHWLAARPRSWREVLGVYLRAGRGLAEAHALGLVHRDFKPDNVLVGTDGRVRVTDFGLARSIEEDGRAAVRDGESSPPGADAADYALTRTGALLGTPAYMAPEQLAGAAADTRSDIYGFCVALYEALYGERPFRGKTVVAQREEKASGAIPPPTRGRNVPPRVRSVLLVGMRARPEERYASMVDLLRALERAEGWPLAMLPRRARWVGALLPAMAVGGVAVWLATRERTAPALAGKQGPDSTEIAVAALAGADARLACPIFEVRGVSDVAVRLGAAAAALACARAAWELGGKDDRVLPPAALLDVPRQPVDGFPDPYTAPEQRARTLEQARSRAAAYVDGVVTRGNDGWLVEVVVRAKDDREIVRAQGSDAAFLAAVKKALEGSWKAPLVRREIDPDVARWTAIPDVDLGLAMTDARLLDSPDGCEAMRRRARELGSAFFYFDKVCEGVGSTASSDAGAPTLDESSPQALAASVRAMAAWESPLSLDEKRRLAIKLEALGDTEKSALGRGRLADAAGVLWALANELERAHASLIVALRDDPLLIDAWHIIVEVAAGTGSASSARSIASAWFPADADFIAKAASRRGDELEERLRDSRLAYVLEPRLLQALHLGCALAEAGRIDDVRAVAATPLGDADSERILQSSLGALIDLHDAKVGQAIGLLEEAGDVAMVDLVVVASVAGRADEVAARWAARFMSLPDDRVASTARAYDTPMVLCMRAGRDLATPCLDRIARLGHAAGNGWFDGGSALLDGARRYAAGDFRGAASAWRPLVVSPKLQIVRVLPTEAFERADEPELAARLDARKLPITFIAGVSDAAPREAVRALAAGDQARARELARSVVRAWEVADIDVPDVARMRRLLTSIGR